LVKKTQGILGVKLEKYSCIEVCGPIINKFEMKKEVQMVESLGEKYKDSSKYIQ
jgi:hypothetical protein